MGSARIRPVVQRIDPWSSPNSEPSARARAAPRGSTTCTNPIECPKCEFKFVAELLLPSRTSHHAPAPVRQAAVVEKRFEPVEVESIEEVEPAADEEVPAIEDVDLGEEAPAIGPEEDTFLEEAEDNQDVSGIVGGGGNEEER